MQRMQARLRAGSRAETESALESEQEWLAADATDRNEAARVLQIRARRAIVLLVPVAVLAALLAAILPLTPGFSTGNAFAASVVAAVTAVVMVAIVPLADRLARGLRGAGAGDSLVFAVALLSVGAAAIHFAVLKMHFDEYTLFGVFFVGAGIAQVVWPIWLLLRRWRPLLVLGALGNALIAAMWGVDRLWGLPLGPEHWKPDPVGFGDSVASAFELLLALGCLILLARGRGRPLGRSSALALTVGVAAVTTLGLLSVLGVGSSLLTPTE